MISLAALKSRIADLYPGTDPLTPEKIDAAYATLSAERVDQPRSYFVSYRTMFSVVSDPARVEAFRAALQATMPTAHEIMLQAGNNDGSRGGLDISDPRTQEMLASFAGADKPLTAEDVAAVVALGKERVPKWPGLTRYDIEAARAVGSNP